MKIRSHVLGILRYLLNKNIFFIFLIINLLCIDIFALSKNYSTLIRLYSEDILFEQKYKKELNSILLKNQSEKWFVKYLEYKKEKENDNCEKFKKLAYDIYRFSYIKDEDVVSDALIYLFENRETKKAVSIFEKEKQYGILYLRNILKKYKEDIINVFDEDKYYALLYSIGFYDDILQSNLNNNDMRLKCYYGKRDYSSILELFNNKKNEMSDESLFYVSKAYAVKDDYINAVKILKHIKNDVLLYKYYYYFYSVLNGKIISAEDITQNISNSYYSGKLIYEILKRNMTSFEKINKESIKDRFIRTKIIAGINTEYNKNEEEILKNSIFAEDSGKLYKTNRKLSSKKNFFKPDNLTLKRLFDMNPTIIYNDIRLTTSLRDEDLTITFFKNYLPEHGLKGAYRIYDKEYHFLRYPLGYIDEVIKASEKYKVDPLLVFSIIREESAFKWDVSERGASGLMQIMPATGKWIEERFDIDKEQTRIGINIEKGTAYLSYLIDRYKEYSTPYIYAVLAYNGGPGNVDRWLKKHGDTKDFLLNIPFFETERYLYKVL